MAWTVGAFPPGAAIIAWHMTEFNHFENDPIVKPNCRRSELAGRIAHRASKWEREMKQDLAPANNQ